MVDCGADTIFLSQQFVDEHKVKTKKRAHPLLLRNIDGTNNKAGKLTHTAELTMVIGDHKEIVTFDVTDLGGEIAVIGIDWLRLHNPNIDWREGTLELNRCPEICAPKAKPEGSVRSTPPAQPMEERAANRTHKVTIEEVEDEGEPWLARRICRIEIDEEDDLPDLAPDSDETDLDEDDFSDLWEEDDEDRCIYIRAGHTYAQQFAEEASKDGTPKSFEEMIPEEFREFLDVFSKEESERMPTRKEWDHRIDLKPGAEFKQAKVYLMSPVEQTELDRFLEENERKGYI